MNQKGFANIILVVVIVILVGAVGYFAFVKKSEQVAQQPTPTPATTQTKTPAPTPTSTPKDEAADWKTYTNDKYIFSIKYPSNFAVDATEGSTNFEKKFLALDMGTPDYIKKLKSPMEGTEGIPLYLRIVAHEPTDLSQQGGCGENTPTGTITIDGISVTKCEGLALGSLPSLYMNFTKNGVMYYSIQSNTYSGTDKKLIDQIISTLKLSK